MIITQQQIKQLCQQYGLTPDTDLGQHFLLDTSVVDKAIQAAKVSQKDTVIEVGPGLGLLTQSLVSQAGRVIAVELDKKFSALLQSQFFNQSNFELVRSDILKLDFAKLKLSTYKVVANIPYGITSRLIKIFLTSNLPPSSMAILVQKEIAQRICAKPGAMSLLSVLAQLHGQPEIVADVSRDKFWPVPKVDSSLILIDKIATPKSLELKLGKVTDKQFWRLAKIGFSSRRKQLQNNLSAGLNINSAQAKKLLVQISLHEKIRPQELSVTNWIKLAKITEKYLNTST